MIARSAIAAARALAPRTLGQASSCASIASRTMPWSAAARPGECLSPCIPRTPCSTTPLPPLLERYGGRRVPEGGRNTPDSTQFSQRGHHGVVPGRDMPIGLPHGSATRAHRACEGMGCLLIGAAPMASPLPQRRPTRAERAGAVHQTLKAARECRPPSPGAAEYSAVLVCSATQLSSGEGLEEGEGQGDAEALGRPLMPSVNGAGTWCSPGRRGMSAGRRREGGEIGLESWCTVW